MQPTRHRPNKQRLDTLLADRELVESREKAKRLILAGEVLVDGEPHSKPGLSVSVDARVEIKQPLRYVSRGGLKLEKAFQIFDVHVMGKTALDVGASTGGFTDCLLQHGAGYVYAVDVGYGQLAWRLRRDSRVRVIERTNARAMDRSCFDLPIEACVVDVSFISLRTVLPAVKKCIEAGSDLILLIKPQFEAGPAHVNKGGVVRDPKIHINVIRSLIQCVDEMEMFVLGITHSPIRGPAGNIEYLLWINENAISAQPFTPDTPVQVVNEAHREFAVNCCL
ncbi:MAG: TlyA family RNA methyltransferase [Candidatus Poribacteria bacterium]|nr:TlyA family RNA methyltransferase [Candidatus Poribacteria bacterium]MDE0503331.1 TlyA family RNA methyltransferase [Candidatus Poribacteria bacterium]